MMEDQIKNLLKSLPSSPGYDRIQEIIKEYERTNRILADLIYSPWEMDRLISEAEQLSQFTEFNPIIDEEHAMLSQQLVATLAPQSAADAIASLGSPMNEGLIRLVSQCFSIPTSGICSSMDETTNLEFNLTELKPFDISRHEYLLNTEATRTIDLGIVKLKTIQQTQMQVQMKVTDIQQDVVELKEIVIKDVQKKDEMLGELLDYFRNGGSNAVKIRKLNYNKKSAELIINDTVIQIRTDTNQHYLCKLLFSSKTSIKRVWEIYDIVEAFGEDTTCLKDWRNIIYNTVRHLNEKIQSQTGLEKFILFDNKTILINPNYLDL